MSKGKKKKPKLVAGAVLGQMSSVAPSTAPARDAEGAYMNRNEDKARNALAGIPIIGGLTSGVMGISNAVRGDGTDVGRNIGAAVFSPTSGMRAVKDAGGNSSQVLQAAFNPIAGAVVGAKLKKEQLTRRASIAQNAANQQLIANSAGNPGAFSFAKGGKMFDAAGIQPLGGGSLEPISEDAVQVKANDPSKTDSVELPQAYVDHNEVIDRENRVFSDVVKAPSGRTIAKEAARLEKMKGGGRFKASNDRIDQKLDKLFQYQELNKVTGAITSKKPKANLGMQLEGPGDPPTVKGPQYLSVDPRNTPQQTTKKALANAALAQRFKNLIQPSGMVSSTDYAQRIDGTSPIQTVGGGMRAWSTVDPAAIQKADSVINAARPFMAKGGKLSGGNIGTDLYNPLFKQSEMRIQDRLLAQNNPATQPAQTSYAQTKTPNKLGLNWGQIGVSAATYAPNIANAFMLNKLKGPASVRLENDIRLNRIDPSAELNSANRAFNQARQTLTTNTAQGSNLTSGVGSLLAKRLAAQNQTYGSVNQLNTQIANQEISANQAARFRNNQLTNQYNENVNQFNNRKLFLASDNIANVSEKIQAQGRERNQMARDQQAFQTIMGAYGDSGVMARFYAQNPELYSAMMKAAGKKSNKMGGKLSSRKNC